MIGVKSLLFAVDESLECGADTGDEEEHEVDFIDDNDDDDDNNVIGDNRDDDSERKAGFDSDEDQGNEKPSSAKSDTTDVRQRKVSFELSGNSKISGCGQPLRIVHSSPSLKKGSPTRKLSLGSATMSIRAVRNLSFVIQSALVVRPYSVTKSTRDSRKPPIAEFYEEMTKVESLNPLRTLHNAIPLKEVDTFFDKFTEQTTDVLVTPVSTPARKTISKRLSARSSTNQASLMGTVTTITCEGNLEEEELESDEILN